MEEVVLVKIESIEKCLTRLEEKIGLENFDINDYDMQDIVVLNLQRACQQAIDLAMFLVSEMSLGVPKGSVDAFFKLFEKKIISEKTYRAMKGMVGFRNVAVHQYQKINYDVVESVVRNHLGDFRRYNKEILEEVL